MELIETLKEVVPLSDTAEFLLLTQNWRGTTDIDSILSRTGYTFGDAKAGGKFSKGTLVAALSALDVGSPEGEPSPLARKVAALFNSANIPTRLHSNMLHYLWIQYAITGGPWAALVHCGSFDVMLDHPEAMSAALTAGCECLEVVRQRGIALSRYAETKPFVTRSALREQFYKWIMRRMFRHDEYTKRCAAHALGDPIEVKTFYDDLVASGRDLGVSMPVMESYSQDIARFAIAAYNNAHARDPHS